MFNFKGSWDDHIPLIEFTYNNSYYFSIQMALYAALYGCRCRSVAGWFEKGEVALIGSNSVLYGIDKVQLIRDDVREPRVIRNLIQM